MGKIKRHSVTIKLNIYPRTEREALVLAAQLAEKLRDEQPNSEAQVVEVEEIPFGSLIPRTVHTGRLTLFENKLIEA